jgi:Icc-related predicted phosphoesterase
MKLLLFSDLHCDANAAQDLVERSRNFDVVICAGDLANTRRKLHVCLDILRTIARPTILVPGNNESLDELKGGCLGWATAHILHGQGVTIDGIAFYGIGGGIPATPFGDWSFDFTEHQATDLMANCPSGGVLVTHSPPKGAVDVASNGQSLGSTAIRAAIERLQPKLVVCGHIHASGGQTAMIGSTTVINAGPGGIEWQLA